MAIKYAIRVGPNPTNFPNGASRAVYLSKYRYKSMLDTLDRAAVWASMNRANAFMERMPHDFPLLVAQGSHLTLVEVDKTANEIKELRDIHTLPPQTGTPNMVENVDLSKIAGNPTHALEQNYHQLMAIQDPTELMQAALTVVKPLVGRGMSDVNYKRFVQRMQAAAQRGLMSLQKYLSDFILAGSGMRVAESMVDSVAGLITDDTDIFTELTARQHNLKTMVESYGFIVVPIQ